MNVLNKLRSIYFNIQGTDQAPLYLTMLGCCLLVLFYSVYAISAWTLTANPETYLLGPIKANTALGILMATICVLLYMFETFTVKTKKIDFLVKFISILIFLLAFLTILQNLFKFNFEIDQFLASDNTLLGQKYMPGRMSPITAVCFLLMSISLFFQNKKVFKNFIPSYWLQVLVLLICFVNVVGHVYKQPLLYELGAFIQIGWSAASSFCVLSATLLVYGARETSYNLVVSPNLGGAILRRVMPFVFIAPVVFGIVWTHVLKIEVENQKFALTAFVCLFIFVFIVMIYFLAQKIEELDKDQLRILANKKKLREEINILSENFKISETKFKVMGDAMPLMVWSTLPDGSPDYFNKKWYDFTGVPDGYTNGDQWITVLHPDDQQKAIEAWSDSVRGAKRYMIEYRLKNFPQNTYRWVLAQGLPIFSEGANPKVLRWIGTCTDIDDQKSQVSRIEKLASDLQNSLKIRDEFLSIASHELKTPVTSLKLQWQIFMKKISKSKTETFALDEIQKMGEQTEKQVSRLGGLIENMMDITRVRAGKLILNKQKTNFVESAKDVVEKLKSQFIEMNLSVPELRYSEPEIIGLWDKLRLEQVFTNLVTNAFKYGEGKPIQITLSAEDNLAIFEVRDQGMGIPEDKIATIFDSFSRVNELSDIAGLGLGLFIVKQIVSAHGGTIEVDSKVQSGSRFIIRMPKGDI